MRYRIVSPGQTFAAVLTAYKIKINRKLQRLHNLLTRYLIDKGEALFQIFKNAVLMLCDILQSVKFYLEFSFKINIFRKIRKVRAFLCEDELN
jgi:hypothetical protein